MGESANWTAEKSLRKHRMPHMRSIWWDRFAWIHSKWLLKIFDHRNSRNRINTINKHKHSPTHYIYNSNKSHEKHAIISSILCRDISFIWFTFLLLLLVWIDFESLDSFVFDKIFPFLVVQLSFWLNPFTIANACKPCINQ